MRPAPWRRPPRRRAGPPGRRTTPRGRRRRWRGRVRRRAPPARAGPGLRLRDWWCRARPPGAPRRPRATTPRRCRPPPPGRVRWNAGARPPLREAHGTARPGLGRGSRATTRSSSRWVASSAAAASAAASSSAIEVTQGGLALVQPGPLGRRRHVAVVESGELPADQVQAQRPELLGQRGVRAGRGGLALEGPHLAAHLAQQVTEALEVLFGGRQPALGPLAATPVLQDAGGLFDHGPPVLGTGVQDAVELALADDDVLLTADAGVREQLLDVEEPARLAVDGVLAVARAEQRAGDGDLGQAAGKPPGAVVDGERHLGPAELRTVGRSREDDVFHLRRAHGARPLGAEHPRHGVDDVGLAAAVRADHDGDAGLQEQRRRIREGLEALEGQRLQEHRSPPYPSVSSKR